MKTGYGRYDKGWALHREDMARRRIRMLLVIAGMIGLGTAVLLAMPILRDLLSALN